MLWRWFKRLIVVIFLIVIAMLIGIAMLWKHFKNEKIIIHIHEQEQSQLEVSQGSAIEWEQQSYTATIQGLRWDKGRERYWRLNIKILDMSEEQDRLEKQTSLAPAKPSSAQKPAESAVVDKEQAPSETHFHTYKNSSAQSSSLPQALWSWVLNYVELHIETATMPYGQGSNILLWFQPDLNKAFAEAKARIDEPLRKPLQLSLQGHYHSGHAFLKATGDIQMDLHVQPDQQFTLSNFSYKEDKLVDVIIEKAEGSFKKGQLRKLRGDVRLRVLNSRPLYLDYRYSAPQLEIFENKKRVIQGLVEPDSLTAQGLLKLQDFSVTFLGIKYKFKQIDWNDLHYNWDKQAGLISFENIQMAGMMPMSVDKVECEGDISQWEGVCHMGKVTGPQGVTFDGVDIVVSGFNDLMGTFNGSVNPVKMLPFKIPFLSETSFQGSFVQKEGQQYLLIHPNLGDDSLLQVDRLFYQQNESSTGRWVLEAHWKELPLLCYSADAGGYECYLGQSAQDPTDPKDCWRTRTEWATQKVHVQLPPAWGTATQIHTLQVEMMDPTLWRLEALDHVSNLLGQMHIAWDEGPEEITAIDGELWDMGFQGVWSFDGQKIEVAGHNLNADLLYYLTQALKGSDIEKIIPQDDAMSVEKMTIDFQHLYASSHDWGKVHLSHHHDIALGEKRWTVVHPILRGQMLEKDESGHVSREAVIYLDKPAGLAPLSPVLEQLGRGHVVLNYHQNPAYPHRHHFYLSATDLFLKDAACQQLQLLDVLSGYAFSSQQFQALLHDGWLIDKLSAQGVWETDQLMLKKAYLQSGATSFEASGTYDQLRDNLAIDLHIHPKVSSALPSLGFLLGPIGAGLTLAGVQFFGAENVDQIHEQKWQLCGSLKSPEVRPWQAEVVDFLQYESVA